MAWKRRKAQVTGGGRPAPKAANARAPLVRTMRLWPVAYHHHYPHAAIPRRGKECYALQSTNKPYQCHGHNTPCCTTVGPLRHSPFALLTIPSGLERHTYPSICTFLKMWSHSIRPGSLRLLFHHSLHPGLQDPQFRPTLLVIPSCQV